MASFMDANRRKNGAPQPDQVETQNASEQRATEQLIPNEPLPTSVESRLFKAGIKSSAAINQMHYQAGLTDQASVPYTDKIPSVGGSIPSAEGDRALKMR